MKFAIKLMGLAFGLGVIFKLFLIAQYLFNSHTDLGILGIAILIALVLLIIYELTVAFEILTQKEDNNEDS